MEQKDHQQASDKIAAHYALAVPSTFLIRIGRLWSTASTPRSAYSLNMPSGQPTSSWSATAFSRVFGESAARLPPSLPYPTIPSMASVHCTNTPVRSTNHEHAGKMVWPGKTRWQLGPSWKKVESRINGVNLPDGNDDILFLRFV